MTIILNKNHLIYKLDGVSIASLKPIIGICLHMNFATSCSVRSVELKSHDQVKLRLYIRG